VLSEMGCACVAGVMARFGHGRYAEEGDVALQSRVGVKGCFRGGPWALGVGRDGGKVG
jgi:hypothetical protein